MNATIKRAKPRKQPQAKSIQLGDAEYLQSLPLWLRQIELMARPLRGKLTKAINQK